MTFTIAKITERDTEGFRSALDIVCKERLFMAFLEAPSLESCLSFVRRNIESGYPQFVAKCDDKVVGWCDILPNAKSQTRKHMGVLGMGLLPEVRGQGVGKKLLQTTIDAARAYGMTRIVLDVRNTNENAIALYKLFGFEIEGLHRNDLMIDGVYHHSYSMALLFE